MVTGAQKQAIDIVQNQFPTASSAFWPRLNAGTVRNGLIARVKDPSLIQQGGANVCGMASFANSLAMDDPVQYVWLGLQLYTGGIGRLGRTERCRIIRPSKDVRLSKVASGVDHSDWLILASLRDELNKVLTYAYDAGVPILRDIPLIGIFSPLLSGTREATAGITWPGDLEKALRAVGYTKVVNAASTTSPGGYALMNRASEYVNAGYQVLMLINTQMLGWDPSWTATADHWVKLRTPITENFWAHQQKSGEKSSGVKFEIYNSAVSPSVHKVPTKGDYLPLPLFLNNFYGFVAARL